MKSLVRWIQMPQRFKLLSPRNLDQEAGAQQKQVTVVSSEGGISFLVFKESARALLRGRLQAAQLCLQGRGSVSAQMSANPSQHPGPRGTLCGRPRSK